MAVISGGGNSQFCGLLLVSSDRLISPLCSHVQSPRRTQSSLDGHESGAAAAFQISCSHRFVFDVFARPQIRLQAAGVMNLISFGNQNRQR